MPIAAFYDIVRSNVLPVGCKGCHQLSLTTRSTCAGIEEIISDKKIDEIDRKILDGIMNIGV